MQALWQEAEPQVDEQAAGSLQSVIVLTRTLPALEILLGPAGPTVTTVQTVDMLIERAWRDETTLALLPFDLLTPELAPLAVDGQNPTENNAGFQVSAYPLIVTPIFQIYGMIPRQQNYRNFCEHRPANAQRAANMSAIGTRAS